MMEPLFDSSFLRKLDRLSLLTRRSMIGDMQGERRSLRKGSSVEFADFRPYTVGDDIRQIDWNLYARMEKFFLKLFVAEEELTVHILLDSSNSMNWGEPDKWRYACRVAGAFGYIVLSSLDRVTVTAYGGPSNGQTASNAQAQTSAEPVAPSDAQSSPTPGGKTAYRTLPGVRGKRGALPLFDFLQKLTPGGPGDLLSTCRRYVQAAHTTGPLLLCSDLLDEHWQDGLRALLSRPFEITLLHILAPQEINPQIDGDFRLLDSEGGPAVEITADLDVLQRYRANFNAWRQEVESFCAGRGITYLFVDTSIPVEEFVLSHMRQRGVVH